jgi:SHAQKYF class myb-like DNA-binding protein
MARPARTNSQEVRGVWSVPEHERFIEAMALYPRGPWKQITDHVGTRSIKQVQTHAQKYQQKLMRHQRGLRKRKTKLTRPEHRVDAPTLGQFTHKCIVRYAQRVSTTELGTRPARGPLTNREQREEAEEEEEDTESADESTSTSSPAPQTPDACETSDSCDASDVPESPPSFVGLQLVGSSCEEWEEVPGDIAKDAAFMHLMVDVDPVEPTYTKSYDLHQDWAEWQFADLLKPFEDSPFVEGASQMHTRPCAV